MFLLLYRALAFSNKIFDDGNHCHNIGLYYLNQSDSSRRLNKKERAR